MSSAHIRANEVQKTIEPVRQPGREVIRQQEQGPVQAVAPQVAYRRVQLNRDRLRPADLLALQRAVGNRAVQRMLAKANDEQPGETAEEDAESTVQTKLTAGAPDGVHTQESDRVARQVMTMPDAAAQRPNRTGLPDGLKSGIESLSGMSLDSVKVHYSSSQPAQLNALAYTQGGDIHVAAGQERHLPHEAWHVVQQAQGRVQPTMQMKDGVPVNDDAELEHEADVMGAKAAVRGDVAVPSRLFQGRAERAEAVLQSEPISGRGEKGPLNFLSSEQPMTQKLRQRLASQQAPGSWRSTANEYAALGAPVVQRLLVPFKTPPVPTPSDALVAADAVLLDGLTTAAFNNTWNRLNAASQPVAPVPLAWGQFPGATHDHFAHMANMMLGHDNALKAPAVGNVIEDQVTFGGAIPASVVAQAHYGNAIPDFVSSRGVSRGVIDVTSSGQQGHVLDKSFNKAYFGTIAEATYPSIDFAGLNGGAAPVLGAAALALADQAKRERANSFIGSQLLVLRQHLELLREGVMRDDNAFAPAETLLRQAINGLPPRAAGAWNGVQVAHVDVLVGNVNVLVGNVNPNLRVPNLSDIIDHAHNHYLVAGNPWW